MPRRYVVVCNGRFKTGVSYPLLGIPAHTGFVMFCSFAFFGAMPLLGYVIIPASFPGLGSGVLFKAACAVTGMVLFLLGSVKSKFS